jgi:hypothetical protein
VIKLVSPVRKIIGLLACFVMTAMFLSSCQKSGSPQESRASLSTLNTLTEEEEKAGWKLLFNGETLDGWKRYNHDTIGPLWSVQDGMIVCNGEGLGEGIGKIGGSLITTQQFGNFELTTDWKVSPGGNSGILYHVVEKPEYKFDYVTGPEYQVLDDLGWKGESLGDTQKAGSSYGMYGAPYGKKLQPAGEWNTARIVYNNGHVEHWLNGEKTVEFDESSDDFKERHRNSKWSEYPDWNKFKTGAISLQDHGAPVYFRNIKIREL